MYVCLMFIYIKVCMDNEGKLNKLESYKSLFFSALNLLYWIILLKKERKSFI